MAYQEENLKEKNNNFNILNMETILSQNTLEIANSKSISEVAFFIRQTDKKHKISNLKRLYFIKGKK